MWVQFQWNRNNRHIITFILTYLYHIINIIYPSYKFSSKKYIWQKIRPKRSYSNSNSFLPGGSWNESSFGEIMGLVDYTTKRVFFLLFKVRLSKGLEDLPAGLEPHTRAMNWRKHL